MRIIQDISEGWLFDFGKKTKYSDHNDSVTVNVPHTWNDFDGQDGGADYLRGQGSYFKTIERPNVPKDYLTYLEFDAVASVAEIYIDGEKAGEHRGGYSRFRVNITKYFENKKKLALAVVADNSEREDVYPQNADFTFYGGMYREVRMISVPPSHFDLDYYGAPGFKAESVKTSADAFVRATAYLEGEKDRDLVHVLLRDEEGLIVAETWENAKEETTTSLLIKDAKLWQASSNPYLYALKLELVRSNEVLDEVSCKIGIRSFFVNSDKGFFLNGVSTPLRGVSRHQDKLGKGNALTKAEHREDAEMIAKLGANTVRLAHYQHSQYFYDACDERGLVVWAEIPFISSFNPAARENSLEQMRELIVQNYNHPSICFWGISNEILIGEDSDALYDNLKALNALAKKLDPTRLTTMAHLTLTSEDSRHHNITDTESYNHYFGWYIGDYTQNETWLDNYHKKYPSRILGLSEYGAEGIITLHSDNGVKDYSEEYQAEYHEHMAKVISERPYIYATYVWNMFDFAADARDEGGVKGRNNKGLVTFDRKIFKDSYYVYKAYWASDPFVHIAGRHYADRPYAMMDVKVYSNAKEVTLYKNSNLVKTLKGNKVFVFKDVILAPGGNIFRAECEGAVADFVTFNRVETPNPAYKLPAHEETKNWFEDVEEIAINPAYYSTKDKIKEIAKSEEALATITKTVDKLTGVKVGKAMIALMGSSTPESLISAFGGKKDGGAQKILNSINQELQKIKKTAP